MVRLTASQSQNWPSKNDIADLLPPSPPQRWARHTALPVPGSERIAAAEAAAATARRRRRQKLRQQQLDASDLRQETGQVENEEDAGQTTDEARAIREATLGAEQTSLKHLTREKYYQKQQQQRQQKQQQQQRSRKKRLAQLRSQERALLREGGYAEPDTSNPLISPQMAAPDLVSLRPSTVDYANYVPIRQQKDEAPAQGPLPARPRRLPRRPASAGGRRRGRRGGSRRNVAGRKLSSGSGNKMGKRRKMRQFKGAGTGLVHAAAAPFPQWKVKLLVDAEIKRRKKSDNMRLRFERDFAMEELARARASMRRMKTRMSVAAKAAKRSSKRRASVGDSTASSGDEEGASANRNGDGEKSLEEVFRHATLAAAAKQFVSSTLTTLFNPVSSKKPSEGDSSELGDAQDGENTGGDAGGGGDGGGSPRSSRRSRRKRRRWRQNKKGRNLVACDDFIAVLSAAKESGAILPELGELQVVSARLARPAGVANNTANGDGDLYLDLEQWALCYPGDASEVLRWSCAMAGMHMAVF